MNQIKSIGLIETLGMAGAVEAADTALKAANVSLLGYELNRAGYVTIKLTGDVAAVQAAVASGAAAARKLGNLIATHVLPRPDAQVIQAHIRIPDTRTPLPGPGNKKSKGKPVPAEKGTRTTPDTVSAEKTQAMVPEESAAKKPAPKADTDPAADTGDKPVAKSRTTPKKKSKK